MIINPKLILTFDTTLFECLQECAFIPNPATLILELNNYHK